MNGYLERLVRRGLGRAGAATLRPRGDAPAEILEVTDERPAEAAPFWLETEAPAPLPSASAASLATRGAAEERIPPRAASASRGTPGARPPTSTAREWPPSSGPSGAREGGGETAATPLTVRPQPPPSTRPAPARTPPLPPLLPRAPAHPAADLDPPASSDAPLTTGPARATARETSPAVPHVSRPAAKSALDRAAVEALASAVVALRLPEVAPPWAMPGQRLDDLRLDGDGEPRIEVHIDRLEVLQPTPPPPPPAAPTPRPRHRGFAELAAIRGHARRRWC